MTHIIQRMYEIWTGRFAGLRIPIEDALNVAADPFTGILSTLFLGALVWALSEVFKRSKQDIEIVQEQFTALRREVSDLRDENRNFEYRLRALEEESGPPTNRRGPPRAA